MFGKNVGRIYRVSYNAHNIMTEILCPHINGAAFISQIEEFAIYSAPNHHCFGASRPPATTFPRPGFRGLVSFWKWWWNTKIVAS